MKKTISVFIGLLILTALIYGGAVVIIAAVQYVSSLNSDIAVAIIAAAATAFVSVISILLGKLYETREQTLKEHRERKTPLYEELLYFMQRVMANEKLNKKPTEAEMMDFYFNTQHKMMVWASDQVLTAWIQWRRKAAKAAQTPGSIDAVFQYEDLILAIRRDLGHKNRNFKKGDVLSLFVNDIDEHLSKKK